MRGSTKSHKFDGGIDLHARTMYRCIWNHPGEVLVHQHMKAAPEPFLTVIAPYREALVGCVDCIFTWDLARRSLRPGREALRPGSCSLPEGPSRGHSAQREDRRAEDCGVAPGGMLPQADVYPPERRATRDLLRRRMPLTPQQAALLAQMHKTTSQG